MNPASVSRSHPTSTGEPAVVVRRAVRSLHELDPAVAEHLGALAFVLMRVARADGRFCSEERSRMEELLVEQARISPEHAVLVTEIACHRTELADCGASYAISRGLRTTVDRERRRSVVDLLLAVAAADGCFAPVERAEIAQIAGELGIDPKELGSRLSAAG